MTTINLFKLGSFSINRLSFRVLLQDAKRVCVPLGSLCMLNIFVKIIGKATHFFLCH